MAGGSVSNLSGGDLSPQTRPWFGAEPPTPKVRPLVSPPTIPLRLGQSALD